MKKLTFGNQMLLGAIGIILGRILADMTSNGIFVNLGWIFYGLLFIVHPVWSQRADGHPRIKTYVRITGAVIILIGCMSRFGTGGDFLQSRISGTLGIDAAKGTVVESYDDHSGFHGDGTMYAVLSFEDDVLEKMISSPGGWHALPLTENLETLIYGTRTATAAIGPFIGVTVPKVENGYWFFYDRLGESHNDSEVLDRDSFNYTVAIYDADNDLLYYCEFDT